LEEKGNETVPDRTDVAGWGQYPPEVGIDNLFNQIKGALADKYVSLPIASGDDTVDN
jgi:hypothetical protein